MKNLASAQTWASGDGQPQPKILVLGYTYALKLGRVIPPPGFGYFDVILDKYCLFAVFNKSFNCVGLCLSEVFGRNLSPRPVCHHHSYLANFYFYNWKPSPRILRQHCVLRNLRKNKEIVIAKPDKGNGVVILDPKLYNNAIHELISQHT